MRLADDHARAARTTPGQLLTVAVIVLVIAGLLVALPFSTRFRGDEQRTKMRLRRLGIAVDQWVIDEGFRSFPPIANPPQGTPWEPDRPQGADAILWRYLQGDIPRPQRSGEDAEAWRRRLEQDALTVCPLTGLPFWYNEGLTRQTPRDLLDGRLEALVYFHCQRARDGSWPARMADGGPAVWAVSGSAVHVRIDRAQVDDLRERIGQRAARDPADPELAGLRRQFDRWDQALDEAGGEAFTTSTLTAEVHLLPR